LISVWSYQRLKKAAVSLALMLSI